MENEMKLKAVFLLIALMIIFIVCACQSPKPVTVFMIGDSTMANKPVEDNPERGWGQLFQPYFKNNVTVANYAKNGRKDLARGIWIPLVVIFVCVLLFFGACVIKPSIMHY